MSIDMNAFVRTVLFIPALLCTVVRYHYRVLAFYGWPLCVMTAFFAAIPAIFALGPDIPLAFTLAIGGVVYVAWACVLIPETGYYHPLFGPLCLLCRFDSSTSRGRP